jgi:DNA polymerase-3 subunit delta'
MLFKDVIGQEAAKQHLTEMVEQNRLSHALLFVAKEGSGGLPLALAFAQYVVSLPAPAPVVEDLFGGMTALNNGPSFIHPDEIAGQPAFQRAEHYLTEWRDFLKQYPYGNAYDWLQSIGAENKQGNIAAEECNAIIRTLSLKSFESAYKVLLLWMPEYLGKEGNKLLKLIEEPPPNTLFLLVAENEELILPTILSRCQTIRLPAPDTQEIETALINRARASAETARQVAGICDGNYREALQLLQHADEDWQSLLREWLNATLRGGPIAQVKFVEEVSKLGREKQKQLLRYFTHLLEQGTRIRVLGAENLFLGDQEKDFAIRLNKFADTAQQEAMVAELDKAAYYIERNANGKILFQALTLKLYHIIQNKTLILAG